MAAKFLLHDVRELKIMPVKYSNPALQKFEYVIRGIGPFTHSPRGSALIRCKTMAQAQTVLKKLEVFDLLSTNEQIEAIVTTLNIERLTGAMKRMLMCASWMYGFKYNSANGALFKDVPHTEFTNSNLITLSELRQAKPIRKYVNGNWEDLSASDENYALPGDDTFGIGQPRTKSTKPWTPDEPRDDIDIMDSIRRACNGR